MINKIIAIWHILTRRKYFVLTEGVRKVSVQASSPDEKGIVFELILGALDVKKKQEVK